MSKYDHLLEHLTSIDETEIFLEFSDLEDVLKQSLPDSARRYPAFWSRGHAVGRLLDSRGWKATLRTPEKGVQFTRSGRPDQGRVVPKSRKSKAVDLGATPDLVLIGCVKSKFPGRHSARDLYKSPLFAGRRNYAEATGAPWFILSAKHGLLHPDEMIEAYEFSIKDLSASERRAWSDRVLKDLEATVGILRDRTVEIHAGEEYRNFGLVEGLEARGARVQVPLARLNRGQQASWYQTHVLRVNSIDVPRKQSGSEARLPDDQNRTSELVATLTREFLHGSWNLSDRSGAPTPGWAAMPECRASEKIRAEGASGEDIRRFLTLVAALDRAREADRLWTQATALYKAKPWVFSEEALNQPLSDLRESLASFGVSQRHTVDVAAWRLILEALNDTSAPHEVREAVKNGQAEASALLDAVKAKTQSGQPWFPMLAGPKVSVMWVRMLSIPGGASIEGIEALPVAVDVQVRKVTEYLNVTKTSGLDLEQVRETIQRSWQGAAAAALGPEPLHGTGAALDPPLWFLGKWGCTYCERVGARRQIGKICQNCRFPIN